MSRLLDEARWLVARFVPGAGARPPADEADAYEAAVRQAFLSAEGIEPAVPRRRLAAPRPDVAPGEEPPTAVPTGESPASRSDIGGRAAPGAALPRQEPATEPAREPAVAARSAPLAPEAAVEPAPEPTGKPASEPAPEPAIDVEAAERAPEPVAATRAAGGPPGSADKAVTVDRPARRRRHDAGKTAPDHLLVPPTNVESSADDFFDGLVREVEGDR